MFDSIKTIALSAMIGAGALSAMPAQADSLYLNFGGPGGPKAGVVIGDNHDSRHWDRRVERNACSPERALRKADRMGINRAVVVDVDRRTITVRGRSRGDRVVVTFARAPNCPVIG